MYVCFAHISFLASHGRSKVCISGSKQKTTPTKEVLPKRNLAMQFYGPFL